MECDVKISIIERFLSVKDPRIQLKTDHKLIDILS